MSPRTSAWLAGQRGRGCRRGALIEPEPVRLVETEMSARVPVVHSLARHVAQPRIDDDRLLDAGNKSDRKDLVGPDLQHLVPNARMLVAGLRSEPGFVKLLEPDRFRQVGGFPGRSLGFDV